MPIVPNVAKQQMKSGGLAFGIGVRFSRTVDIARIARGLGYHYLFIDMEHGTMSIDVAVQIAVAALDTGITPVVRVPSNDQFHAQRVLDGGALGIVVPHVNTAEQARKAVENCKLPPLGHRSVSGPMIQFAYERVPFGEANKIMNDTLLLVVMLETPQAIDNVDEIAAVEGIDVLSIGTNDLAAEMGIPGQFHDKKIEDVYRKVAAAARRNGKFIRFGGTDDPTFIQKQIEMGSQMVMLGSDLGFMMTGAKDKIDLIKKMRGISS